MMSWYVSKHYGRSSHVDQAIYLLSVARRENDLKLQILTSVWSAIGLLKLLMIDKDIYQR